MSSSSLEPVASSTAITVVDGEPPATIVPVRELRQAASWNEAGRIRLGVKIPDPKAKLGWRPGKLTRFRLTSPKEHLIGRAAELYGGEPHPWADAPNGEEEWEVITHASWLPVIIPPAAAATQAWELWSGPVCVRRCDGDREQYTDAPCICREEQDGGEADERACRLTTRLSVWLPELPGAGLWRLETHGQIAGAQLATFLRLFYPYIPPMTKLRLGVEKKTRRRRIVDRRTGEVTLQTFVFPLPVLDPLDEGASIDDLLAGGPGRGDGQAVPPRPVRVVAARVATAEAERAERDETAAPEPLGPPGADDAAPASGAAPSGVASSSSSRRRGQTGLTAPDGLSPATASRDGVGKAAGANPGADREADREAADGGDPDAPIGLAAWCTCDEHAGADPDCPMHGEEPRGWEDSAAGGRPVAPDGTQAEPPTPAAEIPPLQAYLAEAGIGQPEAFRELRRAPYPWINGCTTFAELAAAVGTDRRRLQACIGWLGEHLGQESHEREGLFE